MLCFLLPLLIIFFYKKINSKSTNLCLIVNFDKLSILLNLKNRVYIINRYFKVFAMFGPEETNYKTNQSIEKPKVFNRILRPREKNIRY